MLWGKEFKDKVVIITGGSKGLGAVTAEEFAKNGAKIFILDVEDSVTVIGKISREGGYAEGHVVDITDYVAVKSTIDNIHEKAGKIDVLINNAAIINREKFLDQDVTKMDKIIDTNVKGSFYVTKAVAAIMARQIVSEKRKIINIASTGAFIGLRERTVYCASKGAIVQFTKSLALELAEFNINVNAVAPGAMRTSLTERWFLEKPHFLSELESRIPLKRLSIPEEVVGAIMYLASKMADYVLGHVLIVDGGWAVS